MIELSDTKLEQIRKWLGTGSINIFGIQFSGKDTVGKQLAGLFDAQFISSGDVMRSTFMDANADKNNKIWQASKIGGTTGALMPTLEFRDMMTAYLSQPSIEDKPLILSTVGRWIGEEGPIMTVLEQTGHPTKAVILLNITEDEVWRRWDVARHTRNGGRDDDVSQEKVSVRLREYYDKTLPVIEVYRNLGLLIEVNGMQSREDVMKETIDRLYDFSSATIPD